MEARHFRAGPAHRTYRGPRQVYALGDRRAALPEDLRLLRELKETRIYPEHTTKAYSGYWLTSLLGIGGYSFAFHALRSPKMDEPTRTAVAPSSMAIS